MNAALEMTLESKLLVAEYKNSFVMRDIEDMRDIRDMRDMRDIEDIEDSENYKIASTINRFIKITYSHIKFAKNFYPNNQDLDLIEELRKRIIPHMPYTHLTLDIKLCSIPEEIYKEVCVFILFANWQSSIKTLEEIEEMYIYIKQNVDPMYYNIAGVLYTQFTVQWQIDAYSAF